MKLTNARQQTFKLMLPVNINNTQVDISSIYHLVNQNITIFKAGSTWYYTTNAFKTIIAVPLPANSGTPFAFAEIYRTDHYRIVMLTATQSAREYWYTDDLFSTWQSGTGHSFNGGIIISVKKYNHDHPDFLLLGSESKELQWSAGTAFSSDGMIHASKPYSMYQDPRSGNIFVIGDYNNNLSLLVCVQYSSNFPWYYVPVTQFENMHSSYLDIKPGPLVNGAPTIWIATADSSYMYVLYTAVSQDPTNPAAPWDINTTQFMPSINDISTSVVYVVSNLQDAYSEKSNTNNSPNAWVAIIYYKRTGSDTTEHGYAYTTDYGATWTLIDLPSGENVYEACCISNGIIIRTKVGNTSVYKGYKYIQETVQSPYSSYYISGEQARELVAQCKAYVQRLKNSV